MGNAESYTEALLDDEPLLTHPWCIHQCNKECMGKPATPFPSSATHSPQNLRQITKPRLANDLVEIPHKDFSETICMTPRVNMKRELMNHGYKQSKKASFAERPESSGVPGDGIKKTGTEETMPPCPARESPTVPEDWPTKLPVDPPTPPAAQQPTSGPELQRYLGAQSRRGEAPQWQLDVLNAPGELQAHARVCFQQFARNEEELCEDWAVFYHSYTHSALLYEVHAAIAAVLYNFDAQSSPLPRLKAYKFLEYPDANSLQAAFEEKWADNEKDHHDDFRDVGLSAMCSLVSMGPEVSTPVVFIGGYMHSDDEVPFRDQMEDLLCGMLGSTSKATLKDVNQFIDDVVKVAVEHNIDTSKYADDDRDFLHQAGHMLQIFIRRDQVDTLAYAAEPFGNVDAKRQPLSTWYDSDADTSWGQARILSRPDAFMSGVFVKSFVASADATYHRDRPKFQKQLCKMMREFLLKHVALDVAKTALATGWTTRKKPAPKPKGRPQIGGMLRKLGNLKREMLGGPTLGDIRKMKEQQQGLQSA